MMAGMMGGMFPGMFGGGPPGGQQPPPAAGAGGAPDANSQQWMQMQQAMMQQMMQGGGCWACICCIVCASGINPIFCIFSIWACICSGVGKPCGIIGLPPAAPGGTWARTGARTTSISRLGLNGCLTSRPGAPRGG